MLHVPVLVVDPIRMQGNDVEPYTYSYDILYLVHNNQHALPMLLLYWSTVSP
jgi:hypothetical protein